MHLKLASKKKSNFGESKQSSGVDMAPDDLYLERATHKAKGFDDMKRSEFNRLIVREDEVGVHAIGRALVHLFNRQTQDEKQANDTRYVNGRGFTSGDARRGTITAKYYLKNQALLEWQRDYWLARDRRGVTRLGKYYRQILEEAQKKAVAKTANNC